MLEHKAACFATFAPSAVFDVVKSRRSVRDGATKGHLVKQQVEQIPPVIVNALCMLLNSSLTNVQA
jgi:hypothetical protein